MCGSVEKEEQGLIARQVHRSIGGEWVEEGSTVGENGSGRHRWTQRC